MFLQEIFDQKQFNTASFLYIDGKFMSIPYQTHRQVIAKIMKERGLHVGPTIDDIIAATDGYTYEKNIVRGAYNSEKLILLLCGNKEAVRKVYHLFCNEFPDEGYMIEDVICDYIGPQGLEDSIVLKGEHEIRRKFGRN